MKPFVLLLALMPLFAWCARGQIVCAQPTNILNEKPGPRRVAADFEFRNSGNYPVKILRLHSSCSCTTASIEKKTIAPGESVIVKTTTRVKKSPGTDIVTVNLFTNDKEHPVILLRLVVIIDANAAP